MDYEAVRAGYEQAIPFAVHLGLQVKEIEAGRAVVELPDDANLRNHVGSQHAGALFTAGEAASGGAFVGAFAERMGDITPLAESGNIAYKKIARGARTAVGWPLVWPVGGAWPCAWGWAWRRWRVFGSD